jgi:hypothetical protein
MTKIKELHLVFRAKILHNNQITFFIVSESKKNLVDSKKGNNFARRMIQTTKIIREIKINHQLKHTKLMGYFFWVLLILSTMITLLTLPDSTDERSFQSDPPLNDSGDNPIERDSEPPHAVIEKVYF